MTKTIKFNLICDNKPIRTIEALQENFSVEDVLEYYKNGLLVRWLDVRGYDEEKTKVEKITGTDSLSIVKKLIKIFDIEADDAKIEESVHIFQFLEQRKLYKNDGFKVESIIEDYKKGYEQLVKDISKNPNNVEKIKANIAEMVANYRCALDLAHESLFWKLKDEKSYLAIMCLLMNNDTSSYYLPHLEKSDTLKPTYKRANDKSKKRMFDAICEITKAGDFSKKMGDNLHVVSRATGGSWKKFETKDKKCMIISMESGDHVRNVGDQNGDFTSNDVNNNFIVLNGIEYKSNSAQKKLLYVEV